MAEKAAIETDNGTTSGQLPFRRNILLLVAFIEGGAVMAIELAGAKMVAPFYGTSLYVWASVLAVTLSGLTTGYFLGGWAHLPLSCDESADRGSAGRNSADLHHAAAGLNDHACNQRPGITHGITGFLHPVHVPAPDLHGNGFS